MRTLILEDDELVGELLETVVAGINHGASVSLARSLAEAKRLLEKNRYDLYLVDWQLPDGSGLELVKRVRASDAEVPIVMVSGRTDRESVLQAAHYGISGYITKPLDIELLHQRLSKLVSASTSETEKETETVREFLAASLNDVVQLPTAIDPGEVLGLIGRQQELSAAQLAERWREEVALTARLLDVANSSSFRRTGKPVNSLREAINSLGVPMVLNQALALSLDVANKLDNPALKEVAKKHHDTALQVAREAQRIAISLNQPPTLLQEAGLLSRLGEMAVLRVLSQFCTHGGSLDQAEIDRSMTEWSQEYGNRLKVQWKLPLALRELIGAVHYLPKDSTREDRLVMRAAALSAAGQQGGDECQRLLRRIGLEKGLPVKEHQSEIST